MKRVSIRDAQRGLNPHEPAIITKYNKDVGVIMPIDQYNRLIKSSNPQIIDQIRKLSEIIENTP